MTNEPIRPPETPASTPVTHLVLAEALVKLLTTELGDIAELHDTTLTTWQLGSYKAALVADCSSRVRHPFEALRACADRLGGQIAPDGDRFSSGGELFQSHALTTEWLGHRVMVRVLLDHDDVEKTLRRRIAELEEQVRGGGQRG
ncbi:hypothetical protein AB0903_09215 [Streptomyces sp. NPDC048389]|uniref:hypothetical protein n=1 Tax=Streptomyces sp. NPDC048389 TaxID=3154622 RepID=UPI0034533E45